MRLPFSLFIKMHIELRERDGNSVLIKRLFHLLVHIKENAPVVTCFAPYGGENIDTALAVFGHAHIRRRVIEDKRMLCRDIADYFLCFFKIIGI